MTNGWTVIKDGRVLGEGWETARDLPAGVPWIEFANIEPRTGEAGSIARFENERAAKDAATSLGGRATDFVIRDDGGIEIVLSRPPPGVVRS